MSIQYLSSDFAISPQIQPSQLDDLKKEGFKTIICNRPDDEEMNQPKAQELAKKASELGLTFVMLPIRAGDGISPSTIETMRKILMTNPPPYLAYCRSGKRSTALWHAVSNVDFN